MSHENMYKSGKLSTKNVLGLSILHHKTLSKNTQKPLHILNIILVIPLLFDSPYSKGPSRVVPNIILILVTSNLTSTLSPSWFSL